MQRPAVSRRPGLMLLLALLVVAGVTAGVIWDWFNWHPMSAVMMTLAAIVVLLLGVVLAVTRPRRSRLPGLMVLALGVGIVAGQVLGPSRPELAIAEGALTMAVDQPASAEGTGVATCQWSAARDELQVSGDSNLRVDLLPPIEDAPSDLDQRAFVAVSITVGDRWPDGVVARSDNIDLWLSVGGVTDGDAEVTLATSDASTLEVSWTPEGGSARFAGLVDATTGAAVGAPLVGLAGTITWACESPLGAAPTDRCCATNLMYPAHGAGSRRQSWSTRRDGSTSVGVGIESR